jgi:hypothetical protein
MEINVSALDPFPAPGFDQGACPTGVLAFSPVAEAALVEVHHGNPAHSIT